MTLLPAVAGTRSFIWEKVFATGDFSAGLLPRSSLFWGPRDDLRTSEGVSLHQLQDQERVRRYAGCQASGTARTASFGAVSFQMRADFAVLHGYSFWNRDLCGILGDVIQAEDHTDNTSIGLGWYLLASQGHNYSVWYGNHPNSSPKLQLSCSLHESLGFANAIGREAWCR